MARQPDEKTAAESKSHDNSGDSALIRELALLLDETNLTEIDPVHYDVAFWAEHWRRTRVQGVIVNAGGGDVTVANVGATGRDPADWIKIKRYEREAPAIGAK